MVSDHRKAIGMFERAERNSNDSDLKAFAAKHLPGLREHLSTAQNLASQKMSKSAAPKQ
jgi:putative membrane protein